MPSILQGIVFTIFLVASLTLAVYSCHLYVLTFLFRRRLTGRRRMHEQVRQQFLAGRREEDWPVVTTQIPIYNEADVAHRVIETVAAMDYPAGRHEVQVLDDSTDRTRDIIERTVAGLVERGFDVKLIHRDDRTGYKAGALANGLATARGEFIAVFDADFVPPVEFLRQAVPLLDSDAGLACVQGRWAHINRSESWLTEAQGMALDTHFALEQGARSWNGLMMNFNGTAGIWRKAAIEDPKVGGWSGDTITEDLDLSYRAQMAGWRMEYDVDLACPAELPNTVAALKSQQRRWATGSVQTGRKLLPRIWRSQVSLGSKIEATFHLCQHFASLCMLGLAICAGPMVSVFESGGFLGQWFWSIWWLIALTATAPTLTYAYARYVVEGRWSGFRRIPGMIAMGCGLSVNNAFAAIRGLTQVGGEFVRTPKSGSSSERRRASTYQAAQSHFWLLELALGAYAVFCFFVYLRSFHDAFSIFMVCYAFGYTMMGWHSRPATTPLLPPGQGPQIVGPPIHTVEPAGGR